MTLLVQYLACSSPIQVPPELKNMPCYHPKCASIHIHFQKIQHLDFLTDYLRLVHRLMYHPVYLKLLYKSKISCFLYYGNFTPMYDRSSHSLQPRRETRVIKAVELGFELLEQKEEVLLLASTGIAAAHNIGGRNIHNASGTESSIALVRQ